MEQQTGPNRKRCMSRLYIVTSTKSEIGKMVRFSIFSYLLHVSTRLLLTVVSHVQTFFSAISHPTPLCSESVPPCFFISTDGTTQASARLGLSAQGQPGPRGPSLGPGPRERVTQAGVRPQEVRQANLLQSKRGLTVPGGAGCQSV